MKRTGAAILILAILSGLCLSWTSAADGSDWKGVKAALYSLRSGVTALYEEGSAALERCREAVCVARSDPAESAADPEELIARLQNQLANAAISQEQKNVLQDTVNQLRDAYQKEKQTGERLAYAYEQMEQDWARFLERFFELSKRVEELPGRLGKAFGTE